ncbi:MAG: hypothetical protein CXX80_11320 [Methanobacteriota archaeon]|nr:MAG: hypothetical protein CXX80_11320 [Euryarchaeota archaeon]
MNVEDFFAVAVGDIFALQQDEWETKAVVTMPMGEKNGINIGRADTGMAQAGESGRRAID